MAKNFLANIESQTLQKDNSLLKMKVSDLEKKLKEFQTSQNTEVLSLKVGEIKIATNIRDDGFSYRYEDIEELAADIDKNGQLQPVLICKDNYLLAGYRRYNALKFLTEQKEAAQEILVSVYPKNFDEIDSDELINLQLSENNQRRDIDNFQLSKLYNQLLEQGYSQQDLAERFKKSKGLISFIVQIKNIEPELVKLLKQFQVFGWSEKKFNALNFSKNPDENLMKTFEKYRGIIGITTLYKIAKQESVSERRKVFLHAFKNRLSEEEIELFKDDHEEDKNLKNKRHQVALKNIKSLKSLVESLKKKNPDSFEAANIHLAALEKLFLDMDNES